jgi:aryl-alcohol dehydrogenase-like predicted oxidoreductase
LLNAISVSLAQLALAWLIAQPQANAIAGARTSNKAVDNAKAGDLIYLLMRLQEIDAIGRIVTDHWMIILSCGIGN